MLCNGLEHASYPWGCVDAGDSTHRVPLILFGCDTINTLLYINEDHGQPFMKQEVDWLGAPTSPATSSSTCPLSPSLPLRLTLLPYRSSMSSMFGISPSSASDEISELSLCLIAILLELYALAECFHGRTSGVYLDLHSFPLFTPQFHPSQR